MRKILGLCCCILLGLSACEEMDEYYPTIEYAELSDSVRTTSDLTLEEQYGLLDYNCSHYGYAYISLPQGYVFSTKLLEGISKNRAYEFFFAISRNKEDLLQEIPYYIKESHIHYLKDDGNFIGFMEKDNYQFSSGTYYYCLMQHNSSYHPGLVDECLENYYGYSSKKCSDIHSFEIKNDPYISIEYIEWNGASVSFSGNYNVSDSDDVVATGLCYSLIDQMPTINSYGCESIFGDSGITGYMNWSQSIGNLDRNVTYYVRAFLLTKEGIAYSSVHALTTK